MKYIDAEKLIAEIKRRQAKLLKTVSHLPIHRMDELESLLSFIDSLRQEQSEVDLEEFDKDVAKLWGRCAAEPNDSIACLHAETFNEVARHFYELGLKARKEE